MGCATSKEKVENYTEEEAAAGDKSMVGMVDDSAAGAALAAAISNGSFIFAPENASNDNSGGTNAATADSTAKAEQSAEEVLPVNEHRQDGVTYWVEYVPNGRVFTDEQSEESDPDIIGK